MQRVQLTAQNGAVSLLYPCILQSIYATDMSRPIPKPALSVKSCPEIQEYAKIKCESTATVQLPSKVDDNKQVVSTSDVITCDSHPSEV